MDTAGGDTRHALLSPASLPTACTLCSTVHYKWLFHSVVKPPPGVKPWEHSLQNLRYVAYDSRLASFKLVGSREVLTEPLDLSILDEHFK